MASSRGAPDGLDPKGLTRLRAMGDEELPDTRLPLARRRRLKLMARVIASEHTAEEVMYLAGALEDRAKLTAGGQ